MSLRRNSDKTFYTQANKHDGSKQTNRDQIQWGRGSSPECYSLRRVSIFNNQKNEIWERHLQRNAEITLTKSFEMTATVIQGSSVSVSDIRRILKTSTLCLKKELINQDAHWFSLYFGSRSPSFFFLFFVSFLLLLTLSQQDREGQLCYLTIIPRARVGSEMVDRKRTQR